jgi:hypothetical protein
MIDRAVTFSAVGNASVVEGDITPVVTVVTVRAGTRVVTARCLAGMALVAGIIVGVVKEGVLPVVDAVAV